MNIRGDKHAVRVAQIGFVSPIPMIIFLVLKMGPALLINSPIIYLVSAPLCITFVFTFHILLGKHIKQHVYGIMFSVVVGVIAGYAIYSLIYKQQNLSAAIGLSLIHI